MQSPASARISMRLPLLAVIAIFIFLKVPHLSYPFYWDESWPYIAAIKAMYLHGPSLSPAAIIPDLSRGHPLIFHSLAACWMQLFGTTNAALHSFALCISVILLITVYEVSIRLFGLLQALAAVVLLASQEMFLVQSSFLLPEVLVALLSLLAIYFYSAGKYVLCTITAAALVLTKESGLTVICLFAADSAGSVFLADVNVRERLARITCCLIPAVVYGAFLALQRHTNGWYFYPLHAGLIERNFDGFWYRFRFACITDLFSRQHRQYLFLFVGLCPVLALFSRRQPIRLFLPLLAAFCYCLITDHLPVHLPAWLWFSLFSVTWLLATHTAANVIPSGQVKQRRFISLSSVFVLLFLTFSASNFYTMRYIMAPLTFLAVALPPLCFALLPKARLFRAALPAAYIMVCAGQYTGNHGHGDVELGAFDAMRVEMAITRYLEAQHYHQKHISSGPYLELIHLTNPSTGFLQEDTPFGHVKWEIDDSTQLVIFDSIEPDDRHADLQHDTNFRLQYRIAVGNDWGEVYERRVYPNNF